MGALVACSTPNTTDQLGSVVERHFVLPSHRKHHPILRTQARTCATLRVRLQPRYCRLLRSTCLGTLAAGAWQSRTSCDIRPRR